MTSKIVPEFDPQTCPCCDQRVQLYRRALNSAHVQALARVYTLRMRVAVGLPVNEELVIREGTVVWFQRKLFESSDHEYSKLRHWGLLVPKTKRTSEANANGYWAITVKGVDFVENRLRVPQYIYLYNNKLRGFSPDLVAIGDVSAFDYREVLNSKDQAHALQANG